MNICIIKWNICQDIKHKTLESGKTIASTSVATNKSYKDSDWQKIEKACFHNVVAFWKTADFLEKYFQKWSPILIQGEINNRSYEDKEWNKKYISEVIIKEITFVGWSKKEEVKNDGWADIDSIDSIPF